MSLACILVNTVLLFSAFFAEMARKSYHGNSGPFFVDSGTPKMVRKDNVDDYTLSTRSIAIILEF